MLRNGWLGLIIAMVFARVTDVSKDSLTTREQKAHVRGLYLIAQLLGLNAPTIILFIETIDEDLIDRVKS